MDGEFPTQVGLGTCRVLAAVRLSPDTCASDPTTVGFIMLGIAFVIVIFAAWGRFL